MAKKIMILNNFLSANCDRKHARPRDDCGTVIWVLRKGDPKSKMRSMWPIFF